VGAEHDFSPRLEQLLKQETDRPRQRRILELNPDHEIVKRLEEMVESESASEKVGEYAELLYGYAVLAEGSELPDPAAFAAG
jgi:molecular chaperone HtpG